MPFEGPGVAAIVPATALFLGAWSIGTLAIVVLFLQWPGKEPAGGR